MSKYAIRCFLGSLILFLTIVTFNFETVKNIAWRFYPHFFPQESCFLKDGTKSGSGKECPSEREKALAEIQMSGHFNSSLYGKIIKNCQTRCQNNDHCVKFRIAWPDEMFNENSTGASGVFGCTLYSSKALRR